MRVQDLFIHVYWRPAWFWGLALALAAIDIVASWRVGQAIRISGRPLLSAKRRVYINVAILASFVVLSVLRFYNRDHFALAWFLISQIAIGVISVRPLLGRVIALRRGYKPGQ
ncbi:MAG: hypothetical protein ACP5P4_09805, partial [Steroidobacteraceae bacterium]